jgi:peroxiredoxin
MRTIPSFLPLLLLVVACASKGGDQRTVSVRIGGAAGRTCYFERFANNQPTPVDSIVLDADGKGVFKPGPLPLDFYGVALTPQDMAVLVLDSTESAQLEATAGDLQSTVKVTGSAHSTLLYDFFAEAKRHDADKQELMVRVNADRNDADAINRINGLNTAFYERCKAFAREHKASPVALAAVSRLNIQSDLAVFQEVRDALAATIPASEYFIGFRDQVGRMEQQMAAMKAQEEQMARLDNLIPVGAEAPDFAQPTPEGRTLSLSSLRGKVVLIDFWASWCKPCRMEMPNVKRVHDLYKAKGFEVLGVSLDREKGAWTQAIAQDGLPWKHVSDLGFWNNAAAQQYGVSSIPYTVLVDRDGKVIGKNLRGPALEEKLAEIFK